MTPTRPGRRRPWRAVVSAIAITAVTLIGFSTPTAHAEEPAVAVTVTAAQVSGTGPDATVSLSATVRNDGTTPLTDVRAELWRSTAMLRSSAALQRALTAADTPRGSWQPLAETNTAVIAEAGQEWAPGDSRSITISGRLADFGISLADASYWVGVTVLARQPDGTTTTEAGRDRTLITLGGQASELVSVVELSAPPRQLKQNLFIDETLATDLSGRLRLLLDAARTRDWVIDPALLAEIEDMADGYRVRTDTGDGSVEGTGQAAAQEWLAGYALLDDERGSAGLFGRPAVLQPSILDAAATATATTPGTTGTSTLPQIVLVEAPTSADAEALRPLNRPILATSTQLQGGPFRVADSTVVPALLPGSVGVGTVLTPTALNRGAVLDAWARAHGVQVRVLRDDDDVLADATVPAWLTRVPLAELLGRDAVDAVLQPPSPERERQDAALLTRIASLTDGISAYAEAAPTAGVDDLPPAARARAASGWWTDAPGEQDRWLDAVDRRVGWTALEKGVTLSAIARFSLAGAEGDYPVTVTNGLVDPVTVRIVALSDNPQRIRFTDPVEATVAPGTSQALMLHAEAAGSGVVTVNIHAETLAGRRLTPQETITVETTNFGLIGWALVISSGVVLVVTTVVRIRQVRRSQKEGIHG